MLHVAPQHHRSGRCVHRLHSISQGSVCCCCVQHGAVKPLHYISSSVGSDTNCTTHACAELSAACSDGDDRCSTQRATANARLCSVLVETNRRSKQLAAVPRTCVGSMPVKEPGACEAVVAALLNGTMCVTFSSPLLSIPTCYCHRRQSGSVSRRRQRQLLLPMCVKRVWRSTGAVRHRQQQQ